MFGTEAFARMRPGSFFINLARGELVDERALEAALDSGRHRSRPHAGGGGQCRCGLSPR
jgi:phosphoglycerate dehydrogenase-like enzyme